MKKIKTNIKFKKDVRNGQFYGFVTKQGTSWKGCYESSTCKKRIVCADYRLCKEMVDGALYQATLIPMKEKEGFVAISAELVKFQARIETVIDDNRFLVNVKFGNRCFTYDPASKDKKVNSISNIAKILEKRVDIADIGDVVDDFLEAANITLAYYKESMS